MLPVMDVPSDLGMASIAGRIQANNAIMSAGGCIASHNASISIRQATFNFNYPSPTPESLREGFMMPLSLKCPSPDRLFTGRQNILRDLREDFPIGNSTGLFVLWGPPGSGKSQVTSRFVQDVLKQKDAGRRTHVFWIDATSQASIRSGLQYMTSVMSLDQEDLSAEGAIRWMTKSEELWLLIFDNHTDHALDLRPYFPSSTQGRIIITSRLPADFRIYETTGHHIQMRQHLVCELSEHEAIDLFLKIIEIENPGEVVRNDIASIVKELGCHAQSIAMAAKWMQCNSFQVGGFLEKLQSITLQELYPDLRQVLAARYHHSFSQLTKNTFVILQLTSFLHPIGISSQMFCTAADQIMHFKPTIPSTHMQKCHQELASALRCEGRNAQETFNAIMGELRAVWLIDQRGQTISWPPIMRVWVRSQCSELHQSMAELFLFLSLPTADARSWRGFLTRLRCTPHIQSVLRHRAPGAPTFTDCDASFAHICYEGGLWHDAERLQEANLCMRREILGDHHPDTMAAIVDYARTIWERGEQMKGLKLMMKAVENYERLYSRGKAIERTGTRHSSFQEEMVFAMNHLARFHLEAGRWQEATQLYARSQELLGPDHPDIPAAEFFMASAKSYEGRMVDNDSMQSVSEASSKLSTLLGHQHPLVLWSSACAAITRPRITQEDCESIQSSWEHLSSIAGPDHPYTLDLMRLFATALHVVGPPEKAEDVIQSLLEHTASSRGMRHPKTMQAMQLRADCHCTFGQVENASKLLTQLKEYRFDVLGPNHADTLDTKQTLATVAFLRSRFGEAEAVALEVLESHRLHFADHPLKIIRSLQLCSRICQYEEKWSETAEFQREIIKCLQNAGVDKNDARTVLEESIWIWAQSCQGNFSPETERTHGALMERVLLRMQSPDADDAFAVDSLHYLALGLQARFFFREAVLLHGKVLSQRIQTRGSYHPTTLNAASHLARSWTCSGDIQKAEEMINLVREARNRFKNLGEEHPDALIAKRHHALLISAKGRWFEARSLLAEVLRMYERRQQPGPSAAPLPLIQSLTRELANASLYAHFFTDADDLYKRLYRETRAAHGLIHLQTAAVVHDATLLLDWKGDWGKAMYRRAWVVTVRATFLGRNHPYTLTSQLMLSRTMVNMGWYRRAEQLQWAVFHERSRLFQHTHPETLEAKLCLAINFIRQHRFEEAEHFLLNVVNQREQIFGVLHPLTLESRYYLGIVYGQTNPLKGIATLESVVADQTRVLGENEPACWSTVSALAGSMLPVSEMLGSAQSHLTFVTQKHRGRSDDTSYMSIRNKHTQIMLYGIVNRIEDSLVDAHALGECLKNTFGGEHPWTIATRDLETALHELEGQEKLSDPIRQQLRKLRKQLGKDPPSSQWSRIDGICKNTASSLVKKLLTLLQ